MVFELKSRAFKNNELIPKLFTCDGKNLSPELEWNAPPGNTKSFVLIMYDPDSKIGTWLHWILYNLPNNLTALKENIKDMPAPAIIGKNSWKMRNYGGPCPPQGEHKYYFKLYALNDLIDPEIELSSTNIEQEIHSKIIDKAVLMGRYAS